MAKQTFTTGQVLTAAQMTSLQQTAMGGGSATAKVASYTLVAGDAGGTVAMSAAGATTITVNSGLFAAGDTVFIQNLGAGACTVTAGSATVATAGSLILPQNDAGILYFTATGAAIFYDYIQAGAVSPLTTKGDVYTFSTSDARLGVGANATVLTADSAEATGLKWATPTPGGLTLLSTTSLSGTSTSITSINQTYKHLFVQVRSAYLNTGAVGVIRFNATTVNTDQTGMKDGTGYSETSANGAYYSGSTTQSTIGTTTGQMLCAGFWLYDYANTANFKPYQIAGGAEFYGRWMSAGLIKTNSAISSLQFTTHAGTPTWTSGSVLIYGVN